MIFNQVRAVKLSIALFVSILVSMSVASISGAIFLTCFEARAAQRTTLTLSAAASLKDTLDEVKILYAKINPELDLQFNYGASGALKQQIERGAPVDLFVSAGAQEMNLLAEKKLLEPGSLQDLCSNEEVLIVSNKLQGLLQGRAEVRSFRDLTSNDVKKVAIGDPESVPAGRYGKEVLGYFKIYNELTPKLIFAKDVKQVLSYVESGNVDAGLVYTTDVGASKNVRVVQKAPFGSHSPILYPIAAIHGTSHLREALDLIKFLKSEPSQQIFLKHGFLEPLNAENSK